MIRQLLAHLGFYRPRVGDVIRDRYDSELKTVVGVEGRHVRTAHFEGARLLNGRLIAAGVDFIRA